MRYEIQYSVYVDVEDEQDAGNLSQTIYDDILVPAFMGKDVNIFPVANLKPRKDLEF